MASPTPPPVPAEPLPLGHAFQPCMGTIDDSDCPHGRACHFLLGSMRLCDQPRAAHAPVPAEQKAQCAEGVPFGEGWLSLSSAPRDGTTIEAMDPYYAGVVRVRWEANGWSYVSRHRNQRPITFWRPLPAPPAQHAGEEER